MCSSLFSRGLRCKLRFDVGNPSLRSVHARCELIFVDSALRKTVYQAFHSAVQLLVLNLESIGTF